MSLNKIGTAMFAYGVTRVADNPRAVMVLLRSEPTDDDLRALHEALRPVDWRAVANLIYNAAMESVQSLETQLVEANAKVLDLTQDSPQDKTEAPEGENPNG